MSIVARHTPLLCHQKHFEPQKTSNTVQAFKSSIIYHLTPIFHYTKRIYSSNNTQNNKIYLSGSHKAQQVESQVTKKEPSTFLLHLLILVHE
jgi:hypothetical protein